MTYIKSVLFNVSLLCLTATLVCICLALFSPQSNATSLVQCSSTNKARHTCLKNHTYRGTQNGVPYQYTTNASNAVVSGCDPFYQQCSSNTSVTQSTKSATSTPTSVTTTDTDDSVESTPTVQVIADTDVTDIAKKLGPYIPSPVLLAQIQQDVSDQAKFIHTPFTVKMMLAIFQSKDMMWHASVACYTSCTSNVYSLTDGVMVPLSIDGQINTILVMIPDTSTIRVTCDINYMLYDNIPSNGVLYVMLD